MDFNRWIPLDLENFTSISQEVDDVVQKHKELAEDVMMGAGRQAEDALDGLRNSIDGRIDDLENFYYENDMGEYSLKHGVV